MKKYTRTEYHGEHISLIVEEHESDDEPTVIMDALIIKEGDRGIVYKV